MEYPAIINNRFMCVYSAHAREGKAIQFVDGFERAELLMWFGLYSGISITKGIYYVDSLIGCGLCTISAVNIVLDTRKHMRFLGNCWIF